VGKSPHEPEPQPMVSWLAPRVLLHSAQEVVLSGLFANFADKRETMAGLDASCFACGAGETGDLWLDYVSDVGDGFDSTHTIARLVAAETLTVGDAKTRRGRVLVLGGDQVYPSASWERYEERFRLPYELALPTGPGPDMFAVPGNHDWYDGLTSFMRVFCQSGRIGGWTTRQRRSYFALELPRDWWLFGIDIQFDAYIDGPQIEYFRRVMADNRIGPGHKIILATAKPSWVQVDDPEVPPVSWNSLAYFDEAVISPPGAQLAVTITGDLHHYSNYSLQDGVEPKITAGGGGAYLSPTHPLPPTRSLPQVKSSDAPTAEYVRGVVYPDAPTSQGLAGKVLKHLSPFETPTLGYVLAAVYGLVAVLLAAGVKDQATNFASSLNGVGDLFLDSLTIWMALVVVVLGLGLRGWARSGDAPGWAGVVHAIAQLALAWAATLALLKWNPLHAADNGFWLGYEVAVLVALVGVIGGRAILVLYLWLAHHHDARWHANEVLAAQGIADYKNFLRFRIDAQGDLTMYAIGVERVPEWKIVDGEPRLVAGGEFVPEAHVHLIEKISIPVHDSRGWSGGRG
jgi:hypothetical protein